MQLSKCRFGYYLKWQQAFTQKDAAVRQKTIRHLLRYKLRKKRFLKKLITSFTQIQQTKQHIFNTYAYKGGSNGAGSTQLQDFGDFAILVQVAKYYSTNPAQIEKWKVEEVLSHYAYLLGEQKQEMESIKRNK